MTVRSYDAKLEKRIKGLFSMYFVAYVLGFVENMGAYMRTYSYNLGSKVKISSKRKYTSVSILSWSFQSLELSMMT